jgi:predicted AAA+ superfamily ATPase
MPPPSSGTKTGKPARVFTEFAYQTKKTKKGGWDRERRVVAKAEHIELYCARGDMENRIKEQFSLFADRVSAETMRANQMRLYLSAI